MSGCIVPAPTDTQILRFLEIAGPIEVAVIAIIVAVVFVRAFRKGLRGDPPARPQDRE